MLSRLGAPMCAFMFVHACGGGGPQNILRDDAPGTFFIGFSEFGQGHRGPMIPYCPGPH
ncbi:unnamed protein product, partial [Staurois parvus]